MAEASSRPEEEVGMRLAVQNMSHNSPQQPIPCLPCQCVEYGHVHVRTLRCVVVEMWLELIAYIPFKQRAHPLSANSMVQTCCVRTRACAWIYMSIAVRANMRQHPAIDAGTCTYVEVASYACVNTISRIQLQIPGQPQGHRQLDEAGCRSGRCHSCLRFQQALAPQLAGRS